MFRIRISNYCIGILHSKDSNDSNVQNITIEQYSIATLRMFYELFTVNRLVTSPDLTDCLSSSIKVFELAPNYT